jgi:hypothetical protein
MASTLKYIVDDKGHKQSVLVPVKTWLDLNEKYNKLSKKLAVLTGIENAFNELVEAKRSGKELQSLSDFLNESKG